MFTALINQSSLRREVPRVARERDAGVDELREDVVRFVALAASTSLFEAPGPRRAIDFSFGGVNADAAETAARQATRRIIVDISFGDAQPYALL